MSFAISSAATASAALNAANAATAIAELATASAQIAHDAADAAASLSANAAAALPDPSTLQSCLTPLSHAITLYSSLLSRHLRCTLAGHKTKLHQVSLPPGDPRSLQHLISLYPDRSKTVDHVIYGGIPISTSTLAMHASLNTAIDRHASIVDRLLAIPAIPMQIRLLVLTLSARPSSLFAIHVRSLPPHLTASPNAPHPHRPFALSLRSSLLTALLQWSFHRPQRMETPGCSGV